MKIVFIRFIIALVFVLAACSDGEPAMEAEHVGETPLYLAATRTWDDATVTSYFHVVPSLERDTEVDATLAKEEAGPAKLFAYDGLGWFAIGGGEAPTITRYALDERGRLVEGDSISLQPFGVDSLWDSLYFVSRDKAYYPDTSGSQLIVWNPERMEVLGTVPLPETVRDGYLSYYGLTPIMRGDKLIFSVGWFDWNESDSVLDETGLVVVDTKSDEVLRVDTTDRCAGITQAIETESGDAYFVSSALAAATHRLGRLDTAPCALRIEDGRDAFDEDYTLQLSELTGGPLAGEPVPGGGETIFLRVFDEAIAKVTDEDQTWNLTGQDAWRWAKWDVTSDELTPLDAIDPSTADAFWFRIDGKVFASETTENYETTTLIELADDGPREALTVPGFLQGIARIR